MPKAKTCIIALLALVVVIASVVAVFIVTIYKTSGDLNFTVADNSENGLFVNKTCNGNETVNDVFRVHLGCDALKNISEFENGTSLAKDMFKNFFFLVYTGEQSNYDDSRQRRETDKLTLMKQSKDRTQLVEVLKESFKAKKDIQKFKNLLNDPKVNPDVNIDFISEKVWERTGAKIVEKLIKGAAVPVHSMAGGYIGGAVGMALAAIFPPATIALVVGGVFIGRGLGAQLGEFNSKLASDFVNERLLEHAIKPLVKEHFREELILLLDRIRESPDTLCRSDVCPIGYVEQSCQCVKCDGPMNYSDRKGLSSCKVCSQGSIPLRSSVTSIINNVVINNDQIQIGCEYCPSGQYGKMDGRCYKCDKPLQFSNSPGSTKCRECSLGSYLSRSKSYCKKCPCMTYGGKDGQCHKCKHNWYSDPGSEKCIKCPPYQISFRQYLYSCKGQYGCRSCGGYKVYKNGLCVWCDGPMEYNDEYGDSYSVCKQCPIGSIPNSAHTKCIPCHPGTYGTAEGLVCIYCHKESMLYTDESGATTCKTCPLGTYSIRVGCKKCSKGYRGTSKGCEKCTSGYSDIEGATACKSCPRDMRPSFSSIQCIPL